MRIFSALPNVPFPVLKSPVLAELDLMGALAEVHAESEALHAEGEMGRVRVRWAYEGRRALLSELRSLFESGKAERLAEAMEILERERDLEAVQFPDRTPARQVAAGFQKGAANPWYYQNLFTIAHGDRFISRLLKINFSEATGGIVPLAQWARREQSYSLAEVLLHLASEKSPTESGLRPARGLLANLRGESWYQISDQTRDLLADLGLQGTAVALTGGLVGGILSRGAQGLLRLGSGGVAQWGRYLETARGILSPSLAARALLGASQLLKNPWTQQAVGLVAFGQGLTLTRYGFSRLQGEEVRGGYLKNSLQDLFVVGSIPLGKALYHGLFNFIGTKFNPLSLVTGGRGAPFLT